MKKIILILFMFVFMSIFVNSTLVDSEDFNDYIIGLPVVNQSDAWSCSSSAVDNLDLCNGSYNNAGGIAGNEIMYEEGNKFLRVYAMTAPGYGFGHALYAALKWDNINSTKLSVLGTGKYFSVASRMRISGYQDDIFNSTFNQYLSAGLGLSSGFQNRIIFGGDSNDEGVEQLRAAWWTRGASPPLYFAASYDFFPDYNDTSCDFSDYQWHDVTMVIYMNSSYKTTYNEMYMDGNLCHAYFHPTIADAYNSAKPFFDFMVVHAFGGLSLDIDYIELYEDEIVTESEDEQEFYQELLTFPSCPYSNCLFYDTMTYPSSYNISDNGYIQGSGTVYNITDFEDDRIFYLNDGWINNEFDVTSYSYDIVDSYINLRSRSQYTKTDLENETFIYSFKDICHNGNIASDIIVLFDYYDNSSSFYTGYETNINVYERNVGGSQSISGLGSYVIPNGQYFGLKRTYDLTTQKYSFDFFFQENYEEGIIPLSIDEFNDFNAPCDYIDSFQIERLGTSDEAINSYAISEILYRGDMLLDITSAGALEFEYTNKTNQSTALVKTDMGEEFYNFAYTIGFKTTGSRLMFFIIVLIIVLFGIWKVKAIDANGKFYATIFMTLALTIMGWYLGFVPLIVFMFLIMVIVLIAAYTLTNLFKGSPQ